MATGFGCMVVGPAGSGKVSKTKFKLSIQMYLVDDVSHTTAGGIATRQNIESVQS